MQIKLFFLIVPFVLAAHDDSKNYCSTDMVSACGHADTEIKNCNAKYGAIEQIQKELQNYGNLLISKNWQFLLLHTHFANYEVNRPGFTKLYKKYADQLWEDAISVTKYLSKRGGQHDFLYKKTTEKETNINNYDISELPSLAKGLDIWKAIATEAHQIHGEVIRHQPNVHDAETASYIENEFVHKHAEIIRDLAGHNNDLIRLLTKPVDPNIAIWFFDNYIAKVA